jgi:hypothetical protein
MDIAAHHIARRPHLNSISIPLRVPFFSILVSSLSFAMQIDSGAKISQNTQADRAADAPQDNVQKFCARVLRAL